jgi:hypothetical protein
MTFDEAKAEIEKRESWTTQTNWFDEEEISEKVYKKVQTRIEKEKISKLEEKFYKENQINWEIKDRFDLFYQELIEWKNLDSSSAKKFLNIAYREVYNTSDKLKEYENTVSSAKILWGAHGWNTKSTTFNKFDKLDNANIKPKDWY